MNTTHPRSRIRYRFLGLPWSMLHRNRGPAWSVVSHLCVAALAATVVMFSRQGPSAASGAPCGLALGESAEALQEPPAPSEVSADIRGGVPSADGSNVRTFAPADRVRVVVRHNGRRSDEARLLLRVQRLDRATSSQSAGPEIYMALDPRRVVWKGQSLHYGGTMSEILPLDEGLWRLTVMISDPRECARSPLHVCASVDARLRLI